MSNLDPHPASQPLELLLRDCNVQTTRRSGPGGQHRNKVDSGVVITHLPTGVIGQASERRSQHENRRRAMTRLRINLALSIRCQPNAVKYAPSDLWMRRRNANRIAVNAEHDDFPALLAEAMDVVRAADFDVTAAAGKLGISTSQLVKFLKIERQAMVWLNRERKALGLPSLK